MKLVASCRTVLITLANQETHSNTFTTINTPSNITVTSTGVDQTYYWPSDTTSIDYNKIGIDSTTGSFDPGATASPPWRYTRSSKNCNPALAERINQMRDL